MTMHSSLNSNGSNKKQRSVLKRFERLVALKDKDKWDETKSVFGLPKVKTQRVKIKKEKAAETEAAATTEIAAVGAAPSVAPVQKPAAKKEEKKK